MKNGLFTRLYKKAFAFIVALLGIGIAFGIASSNIHKIKANTQYYEDFSQYVVNDWENYPNETKNGLTITNNNDGTITANGTATVTTEFVLPITETTLTGYTAVALCLLYNNTINYNTSDNKCNLFLAYNNGQNISNIYARYGANISYSLIQQNTTYNNACLVIRFAQNSQWNNDKLTPFCAVDIGENNTLNFQSTLNVYIINSLLGPQDTAPDLTKVNYIQQASNISLPISSQINKSFGNELESLIQYTMQAGDEITVNNSGVVSNEIDLLVMTAGFDTYKMTFINDALSNDYNNILLYHNNDTTMFYNYNLGELSAGNITNFRSWASMAINANATITSASTYDNDILSKIFVYSTGTNYETGYTAGYNDARADIEEELQDAYGEGLEQGFQDGYTDGYGEGYDQGAIDGVDTSWLVNLFESVDTFFSIHLLPNLTIGTLFAIPFVLSIAWVIIRILRGGGYGD